VEYIASHWFTWGVCAFVSFVLYILLVVGYATGGASEDSSDSLDELSRPVPEPTLAKFTYRLLWCFIVLFILSVVLKFTRAVYVAFS
jgi:hypothetical protein